MLDTGKRDRKTPQFWAYFPCSLFYEETRLDYVEFHAFNITNIKQNTWSRWTGRKFSQMNSSSTYKMLEENLSDIFLNKYSLNVC